MTARKHSRQRDSIREFLMTRKDHPTADIIYTNVRRRNPSISLGTVYRNLTLLAKAGEISRLNMGDGVDRFDADTSPHYHLLCEKCGSVVDLELEDIGSVLQKAAAHFDGHVAGHVTYFYGTCPCCTKSEKADLSEECCFSGKPGLPDQSDLV
ncbi:MAG: transcriptional repressor [Lachnospiraceae bacterium]|nr:transcriptional repressor [Lachnospiraceae bacterium]